ncbi:MAG: protein-L-isoaspartate(D-aspartate) O-methyltransferase [Chloroflexi bacterium]|nr:protein-L-isoaspartate(D-aspartate) O-methyltransferase [Chloroflexota bacterium]
MEDGFAVARLRLVDQLRREVKDERVLRAVAAVPREMFVPRSQWHVAYEDRPLPIGAGQTISQPLIVAMMTEALGLKGQEKVLEVGTGSGYQAAILAELSRWVVSVERHEELEAKARETLEKLGYLNVEVHLAEPMLGWHSGAPYDAIIVSAGAPKVPQELLDQLVSGGRMVIPVGSRYEQSLLKVVRRNGGTAVQDLGPCRWVPLIGEGAWNED